ncbi:MAG: endosialidase [Defluviitaleaceae bacterium]|nr:endosialidase [Defluviitaleaceae bacterium]
MAVIDEIIIISNGKLSFGDYESVEKRKVSDFELDGNMYNVKTHKLLTRLEKNNGLLLETVPGSTVHNLEVFDEMIEFSIEGFEDSQITMELEGSTDYKIYVNNLQVGLTTSSKSGKVSFSLELSNDIKKVRIVKFQP